IARLYRAAEAGIVDDVKELLQKTVPLNIKDSSSRTPLWIAASRGHTDVVKLLTQSSETDVDCLSTSQRSPIFWPSAKGNEEIVKVLVSAGTKIHFKDIEG
ncbi:ankyrin, partial [Colletotrichum somersetense]